VFPVAGTPLALERGRPQPFPKGIDVTMSSPEPSYDLSDLYEPWDPFESSQIEGTEQAIDKDVSIQQTQVDKLTLCQLTDWNSERTYDDDPPSCIHYSIEWKVKVNNRVTSTDTEQDVVLAPGSYWRLFLQPKLEKLLCRKLAKNRPVKSEDTNVVVSVTERLECDLTKRFDDIDID
jgi:hypothetical protein